MARDEEDDTANEIQDLADEADLPLEELMARYGYTRQNGADQDVPDQEVASKQPQPSRAASEQSEAEMQEGLVGHREQDATLKVEPESADVEMLAMDEIETKGTKIFLPPSKIRTCSQSTLNVREGL